MAGIRCLLIRQFGGRFWRNCGSAHSLSALESPKMDGGINAILQLPVSVHLLVLIFLINSLKMFFNLI